MDDDAAIIFNLTGSNPYNSLGNSTKSSQALERVKSYSESKTKGLHKVIRKKVTKKNHRYGSPESKRDGTLKKCIDSFEQGADPNELIKLEKFLSDESLKGKKEYEEYHKYYIENFLPALKDKVIKSEKLAAPSALNKKIEQSQRPQTIRGKIVGIILSITNRSGDKSYPSAETNELSTNVAEESGNKKPMEETTVTPELSNSGDSDSGVSSPGLGGDDLESPVSSGSNILISAMSTLSQESLYSTLNSAEEDNNAQTENKKPTTLEHLTKTRPKGPSERRSPSKWTKGQKHSEQAITKELQVQENGDSGGQTSPMQSEEKKDEKNAVAAVRKFPMDEKKGKNIPPKEQLSNREFYGTFTTGCALLSIGCFVGAVVTKSGTLCLGLSVMTVVFATAAVAAWYLTPPPSSELTCTNLSSLINNGKSPRHV